MWLRSHQLCYKEEAGSTPKQGAAQEQVSPSQDTAPTPQLAALTEQLTVQPINQAKQSAPRTSRPQRAHIDTNKPNTLTHAPAHTCKFTCISTTRRRRGHSVCVLGAAYDRGVWVR